MLAVQRYLQQQHVFHSAETCLANLTRDYGIKVAPHPTLPLIICNYSQTEGGLLGRGKTDPIIRECRALVLERDTWNVVARSFPRFFNWGEVTEEMERFEFRGCQVTEKLDGSLILLFHYRGQWHYTTRGSWADGIVQGSAYTWRALVERGIVSAAYQHHSVRNPEAFFATLCPAYTYVCELTSPINKVVRSHSKILLTLLSAFVNATGEEVPRGELSEECPLPLVNEYGFRDLPHVEWWLRQKETDDPTFEGVVLRDRSGLRYKIKTATYLGLHRLKDNGNCFILRNLLPFVLNGEASELLTYFPEVEPLFRQVERWCEREYCNLADLWDEFHRLPEQKAFALAIKGKTPFTGILFSLRKQHGNGGFPGGAVRDAWREAGDLILKHLPAFSLEAPERAVAA